LGVGALKPRPSLAWAFAAWAAVSAFGAVPVTIALGLHAWGLHAWACTLAVARPRSGWAEHHATQRAGI
jgi:hypothetical protein